MTNPEILVKFKADLTDLNSKMKKAMSGVKSFGKTMQSVGTKMTVGLTTPIAGVGFASVKLASDLEESLNKVNVAFGNSAKEVENFADTTLKRFGIARGSALEMASLFGDMSTSMGFTQAEASKMSMELTGLAGDLASFKNISVERAQVALAGIFTGETEALKTLGIMTTEQMLKQEALNQGITKSVTVMTPMEKIQLRLASVMRQTTNAQGDFERTQEGAANQMRIFQEGLKQLGEQVGDILLPAFTKFVSKLNNFMDNLASMSEETKRGIISITTAVALLGPAILGLGIAFNVLASPITLVAVGIAGLVVLFDYVRRNLDVFANNFINQFTLIKFQVLQTIRQMVAGLDGIFSKFGVDILDPVMKGIDESISDTADKLKETAEGPEFQSFREYWGDVAGDVENAINKVDLFKKAIPKVDETQLTQVEAKSDVGVSKIDETAPAIQRVNVEINNTQDSINALTDELFVNTAFVNSFFESLKGFAQGVADGFSQAIVAGENLSKVLKQLLKQLASQLLQKFLTATLTGGLSVGGTMVKGFFGKGGGLFGKIFGMAEGGVVPPGFPNDTYPAFLTSGETVIPAPRPLPSMTGQAIQVTGEFRVRGSDLVTAISNANNRTLR